MYKSHVNSKFSLCQLPVRANSKNKTDITQKVIYRRTVLLFTLAPLLLYIIKHSSNVSLIRGRFRNPATFQTKCFMTKDTIFQQLIVVWKSSILDLEDFLLSLTLQESNIHVKHLSSIFAFAKIKNESFFGI